MEGNKNLITVILIIVVIIIISISYLCKNASNKKNNSTTNNITVSSVIEDIKIFQTSKEINDNQTGIYKFNDDGTFEYLNIQTITEDNQVLTMNGNYKIENKTLILTISNKKIATQGYLKSDENGSNLCEYKIESNDNTEEQKYNLEIINNNYLKGDNLTLYPYSSDNKEYLEANALNIPKCFEKYTIEEIKKKALDYYKKNELEKSELDQTTEFTIGVSLNKNDIPKEYNNYDMYIEIRHIYKGNGTIDARYYVNSENLTGIDINNQEINLNS